METSDRRLMAGVRRGSPEAVEALIERHWDRAHRVAFGILGDAHAAEDVTQEAMLSVVANVGRLDPYRPFAPWLHAVVSNRALDWARARTRRGEAPMGPPGDAGGAAAEPEPDGDDPPAEERWDAGNDRALAAALAQLSPDHRAVVVLRFIAGYGPKQIGQLLGVPTGTVGSRLRRALDQMRAELEDDDG